MGNTERRAMSRDHRGLIGGGGAEAVIDGRGDHRAGRQRRVSERKQRHAVRPARHGEREPALARRDTGEIGAETVDGGGGGHPLRSAHTKRQPVSAGLLHLHFAAARARVMLACIAASIFAP